MIDGNEITTCSKITLDEVKVIIVLHKEAPSSVVPVVLLGKVRIV